MANVKKKERERFVIWTGLHWQWSFYYSATVIVIEEADKAMLNILNDAAPQAEKNFGEDVVTVHISTVQMERANVDSSFKEG